MHTRCDCFGSKMHPPITANPWKTFSEVRSLILLGSGQCKHNFLGSGGGQSSQSRGFQAPDDLPIGNRG